MTFVDEVMVCSCSWQWSTPGTCLQD